MSTKITIQPKVYRQHGWENPKSKTSCWKKALPFVMSTRGILMHRTRHVSSIFWRGSKSHDHADFWCGGATNRPTFDVDTGVLLLCERCEAAAIVAGLPSATELAGHHVHVGHLRAVRTCCIEENN